MTRLDASARLAVAVVGITTLFFLAAPMLIIALASLDPGDFFTFPPESLSLRWYGELLGNGPWRSSIVLTLLIAAGTAVAAGSIGTLAGIAIARSHGLLRKLLYPLVVAPVIVPAIVLGISFYTLVLQLHVTGQIWTFVAANTLLTTPIVTLLVASAAQGMDPKLEFASLACGASPARTLVRVTLPYVAPTALAGAVIAFLLSVDEVVMSVFLVTPNQVPLAVKMFLQVQNGTAPIVTAAATLIIVTSVILAALITIFREVARRRQLDRAGRRPLDITLPGA